MEPEGSLPYSQAPATCPYPEPLWTIRDMIRFYGEELLTSPNPQAGEQPLVGCPRLLIQYIRSYPPSATCGRAMLWWQTPTCHGLKKILVRNTEGYISPKFVSVCKYAVAPQLSSLSTHTHAHTNTSWHFYTNQMIAHFGMHHCTAATTHCHTLRPVPCKRLSQFALLSLPVSHRKRSWLTMTKSVSVS